MKLIPKKVIYIFFTLFFIFGCSTNEVAQEKEYSEDTNRAFSMIEQNGSYRSSKGVGSGTKKKISPPVLKARPGKNKNANEDKLIEINQKLAFYCMKNRHQKKYKNNESVCMKEVTTVLKSCQIKYHDSQNEVINCLNRKLNLRS